ncbi:uncharacterized protein TNIN_128351 [Trichonephila inaurata madagascariensis]|uniref:Uncharacterized protein n=1 Tax=Trichonephila inaurata madagascariensis TaxID=2747483 RepID=A0A8X7C1A1_9ARAC|nr:uncharacterized protein TNIN_128351 [Trichonephila inaurata madagascariensis]
MAGRYARAQSHRGRETSSSQSSGNRAHKFHSARGITTAKVAPPNMEYYYAIVATVTGLSMVLYWNTLGADFAYDDRKKIDSVLCMTVVKHYKILTYECRLVATSWG